MALMQLGNFRFTTPESGLGVCLGQLPLDLHLLSIALKTHIRISDPKANKWAGKGPGPTGKIGHRLRMKRLAEEHGIPNLMLDHLPKETNWQKEYSIDTDMEGEDISGSLRLYTDGSKLDGNSGYGATLIDGQETTLSETYGTKGPDATVFQAECWAIIEGTTLIPPNAESVTILTDNQAVVKSLDSHTTTNKTVKHLKNTLNALGKTTKVTVRWIKAHVGYIGNERADELAKLGSAILPIGPGPHVPLAKTHVNNLVDKVALAYWEERWNTRTDARQTAIFFPKINMQKSQEIVSLTKTQIGPVVRALTGHDFRKRHQSLLDNTTDNQCRLCKIELETPSHIINNCPTLLHLRAQVFNSYIADISQVWTAKAVSRFLSAPHIAEMEADPT